MTKDELYNQMLTIVPVKDNGKDFRVRLTKELTSYQQMLGLLDEIDRPNMWDDTLARLKQLCDGILRAVENEYRGMRHSAYTSIKNQLDGYKSKKNEIKGLAYDKNIFKIKQGTSFYRMRKVKTEERHKLGKNDLFHIPLDRKGLVTTQRYSAPGYPCLYLSHRIYGCWEEMGRPDFGTAMVSHFKSLQEFNVLDLRIPSKAAWDIDMKRCILFFPLVIATMVQVENSNDAYKPEYTIPQILTEWVISRSRHKDQNMKDIIGIIYTSSQKSSDFEYPDDSWDNYAIPVLQPLANSVYCPRLNEIFSLSSPTYYDLEVLKQGDVIDGGAFDPNDEERLKQNIDTSRFGVMERYLIKYPTDVLKV